MIRLLAAALTSAALFAGTAKLDGAKIHYTDSGKGKQALILIHGWTCDETFWSANVPALAERYRVIALDLPGHGQSDPAPDYSMERFARAVKAVADKTHVKRSVLIGHSMGGAVMLAFARLYPDDVRAIVAVDAAFLDAATVANMKGYVASIGGENGKAVRAKMIDSMFSDATPAEAREHIRHTMMGAPDSVAAGAMASMFAPDFWHADHIDVPMLEIASAKSAWATEASLRTRFPRAELKRIPGTGHFLMMEKPAEFNSMLLDWLGASISRVVDRLDERAYVAKGEREGLTAAGVALDFRDMVGH